MSNQKDKVKYHGDYPIEIKYFEAAIEAAVINGKPQESESIRNFGTYLINIAYKTKEIVESQEK